MTRQNPHLASLRQRETLIRHGNPPPSSTQQQLLLQLINGESGGAAPFGAS